MISVGLFVGDCVFSDGDLDGLVVISVGYSVGYPVINVGVFVGV